MVGQVYNFKTNLRPGSLTAGFFIYNFLMSKETVGCEIKIENVWKVFGNTDKDALDAIQNENISKQEALEKYNSVIGVSNVSFDVNPGEIFCVMGLSGSGKSTLVRHINRLLEPTSGKILIDGQDVMKLEKEKLQDFRNKKIGMVFQNFALMPHRSVIDLSLIHI